MVNGPSKENADINQWALPSDFVSCFLYVDIHLEFTVTVHQFFCILHMQRHTKDMRDISTWNVNDIVKLSFYSKCAKTLPLAAFSSDMVIAPNSLPKLNKRQTRVALGWVTC